MIHLSASYFSSFMKDLILRPPFKPAIMEADKFSDFKSIFIHELWNILYNL